MKKEIRYYKFKGNLECWNCNSLGDILSIKKGKKRDSFKCPICGCKSLRPVYDRVIPTPLSYSFIIDEKNGVMCQPINKELYDKYYRKSTVHEFHDIEQII